MEQYSKWNAMSVLCEPVSTPHKEVPRAAFRPTLLYRRDCPRQRRIRVVQRVSAVCADAQERTIKFGHLNNPIIQ